MRIFTISAAFAVLMGGTIAVQADGMYGKASYKDTVAVTPFSWTGLYIGGSVGFGAGDTQGKPDFGFLRGEEDHHEYDKVLAFQRSNSDGPDFISLLENFASTDYDVNGSVYGIHIGYNRQHGNIVYGIEGAINGSEIDGSTTCLIVLKCDRELDYYSTIVGRLGYAVDRTLFYALGGVAFGEVNTDVSVAGIKLFSGEETHTGWTAGVGIEHALSNHFIVRVEYAHVDLGEENTNLKFAYENFSVKDRVELEFDTIKIGASYKFGDRREALESLK